MWSKSKIIFSDVDPLSAVGVIVLLKHLEGSKNVSHEASWGYCQMSFSGDLEREDEANPTALYSVSDLLLAPTATTI